MISLPPTAASSTSNGWRIGLDRRGGTPITSLARRGRCQRLAPRVRIPSWPGTDPVPTNRPKIRLQSLPAAPTNRERRPAVTPGPSLWKCRRADRRPLSPNRVAPPVLEIAPRFPHSHRDGGFPYLVLRGPPTSRVTNVALLTEESRYDWLGVTISRCIQMNLSRAILTDRHGVIIKHQAEP